MSLIMFRQPFNNEYVWFNTTDNLIIPDPDVSSLNYYMGGAFQQATSVVSETSTQTCLVLESYPI